MGKVVDMFSFKRRRDREEGHRPSLTETHLDPSYNMDERIDELEAMNARIVERLIEAANKTMQSPEFQHKVINLDDED